MSLTQRVIDAAVREARKTGKRVTINDGVESGLSVIVGPSGSGRFAYAYRARGTGRTADDIRSVGSGLGQQSWSAFPRLAPKSDASRR